jgi:hypothetical protein
LNRISRATGQSPQLTKTMTQICGLLVQNLHATQLLTD